MLSSSPIYFSQACKCFCTPGTFCSALLTIVPSLAAAIKNIYLIKSQSECLFCVNNSMSIHKQDIFGHNNVRIYLSINISLQRTDHSKCYHVARTHILFFTMTKNNPVIKTLLPEYMELISMQLIVLCKNMFIIFYFVSLHFILFL